MGKSENYLFFGNYCSLRSQSCLKDLANAAFTPKCDLLRTPLLAIASDLGTFLEFHVWIRNNTSQCVLIRFVPLGCDDVKTGQFLVIRSCLQDSYDHIRSDRIVTIKIEIPLRSDTIITIIVNDLLRTGTCRCVLIRA